MNAMQIAEQSAQFLGMVSLVMQAFLGLTLVGIGVSVLVSKR